MTPAPSVVAIMAQKTRSIIDLVSRMLLSPRMPASSEPLTAMAPTQHSRLAVTKPSASDGPPSCRCTCASTQVPRRWMAPSMFSSAPTAAPSVMDTMTMRMLRHSIAPEMPIYSTHSPRPTVTVLLTRSGMPRRNNRPTAPPATMASALTMAPVMLMNDPLLPPRPLYLNKVSHPDTARHEMYRSTIAQPPGGVNTQTRQIQPRSAGLDALSSLKNSCPAVDRPVFCL